MKVCKDNFKKLYIDDSLTIDDLSDIFKLSPSTITRKLRKFGIRKYDYVKHSLDHDAFSKFSLSSCYWAGFIAADGNIVNNNNAIKIKLKRSDKNHLIKLCRFLKRDLGLYEYQEKLNGKLYDSITLSLSSENIKKNLKDNFNIHSNKTFSLQPPLCIPRKLVSHYIRGFMDGDGSIGIKKNKGMLRLHFCSGSRDILDWIHKNMMLLDNKTTVRVRRRKASNLFELEYCNKKVSSLLNWIYLNSNSNILLDRKYKIFKMWSLNHERIS